MIKKSLSLCLLCALSTSVFSQKNGVGIETDAPQETLHVVGSLRLEHPSQSDGYILQVFDKGSMKWAPLIPNTSTGRLGLDDGTTGLLTGYTYLNGYITLPPGQWLVKVSMLIPTDYNARVGADNSSLSYNDLVVKIITHFTDSQNSSTRTQDYVNGSARNITGSLITPSPYGMVERYAILENKTRRNKTYYVWGKSERNSVSSTATNLPLYRIGGAWGESRIFAIPVSTNVN